MGFALGNTAIGSAVPLDAVEGKNSDRFIAHIKQLVDEYEIERILMGYPLNMDGTRSETTGLVENFGRRLEKSLHPPIKIEFVDERLTSFEAEEELKALYPDYRKRKKFLDSTAALVILRSCMAEESKK